MVLIDLQSGSGSMTFGELHLDLHLLSISRAELKRTEVGKSGKMMAVWPLPSLVTIKAA